MNVRLSIPFLSLVAALLLTSSTRSARSDPPARPRVERPRPGTQGVRPQPVQPVARPGADTAGGCCAAPGGRCVTSPSGRPPKVLSFRGVVGGRRTLPPDRRGPGRPVRMVEFVGPLDPARDARWWSSRPRPASPGARPVLTPGRGTPGLRPGRWPEAGDGVATGGFAWLAYRNARLFGAGTSFHMRLRVRGGRGASWVAKVVTARLTGAGCRRRHDISFRMWTDGQGGWWGHLVLTGPPCPGLHLLVVELRLGSRLGNGRVQFTDYPIVFVGP